MKDKKKPIEIQN